MEPRSTRIEPAHAVVACAVVACLACGAVVIIGNEPKGLWKKAFALAKTEELLKAVEDTLKDQ